MRVEFIFDKDCPNVEATRSNLKKAFIRLSIKPNWQEWDRASGDSPPYVKSYGSPTILINGNDILEGETKSGANSCRIYRDSKGVIVGVPTEELITRSLKNALRSSSHSGGPRPVSRVGRLLSPLAAFPAAFSALIPSVLCPACLPAYLSFLSTLGVGIFITTKILFIVTLLFLGFALTSFGFHAVKLKYYFPFCIGIIGSVLILLGKFVLLSSPVMIVGIIFLVGSSIWDTWLYRKMLKAKTCVTCTV